MLPRNRARDRRWVRLVRAQQAWARAVRSIVESTVDALENPVPFEYAKGHQRHFLERLERLPDDARDLALRVYYNHSLSRFVVRRALDRPLDHAGAPQLPAGGAAPHRLSFALAEGPEPSWLVMEEAGQVITCLAPGMEAGGDQRPHRELVGWIHDFERWTEQNRSPWRRALVERVDRDVEELWRLGWWAPRESVRALADLGDVGGPLLRELFRTLLQRALQDGRRAIEESGGETDDLLLRRWLRSAGTMAALCAALADGRTPAPPDFLIEAALGPIGPELGMVVGAALARWHPADGGRFVRPADWATADVLPCSAIPAAAIYWGTLRRLTPRVEREAIRRRVDPELAVLRAEATAERDRRPADERTTRMMLGFHAELATLALGGDPGWGEDRVEFPQCLPPLGIEDSCLPGRSPSPRGLRRLAQRLLCDAPEDLSSLFSTRAELRGWRERLGDPETPRAGAFHFPYSSYDPPRTVPQPPAARNDPCPCGSGRKYKRCCGR